MGTDGGRPVPRLTHPQEEPKRPTYGRILPLPTHGVRRQRPILLYGNIDGIRPF